MTIARRGFLALTTASVVLPVGLRGTPPRKPFPRVR